MDKFLADGKASKADALALTVPSPSQTAASGSAVSHSSSPAPLVVEEAAAPSEMQPLTLGFLDGSTVWPRKLREATSFKIIQVDMITLQGKETGDMYTKLFDGVPTVMIIVGKKRGEVGSGICGCCFKIITAPKKNDLSRQYNHLKKANCKQPEGKARAEELKLKSGSPEDAPQGTLWPFDKRLVEHAAVTIWTFKRGRAWAICSDPELVAHELRISGGGYKPPCPRTLRRLNYVAVRLTTRNIALSLERGQAFAYGALPFMGEYYDGWTSNTNTAYHGHDGSWYDPLFPGEVQSATLGHSEFTGSHGANQIALANEGAVMNQTRDVRPTRSRMYHTVLYYYITIKFRSLGPGRAAGTWRSLESAELSCAGSQRSLESAGLSCAGSQRNLDSAELSCAGT